MAEIEVRRKTREKVRPVRVRIYYDIIEKICEQGDFIINGRKIQGIRNYYYTSGIWLTWKLPRSKKKLIQSIQKWKWSLHGISYDHSKMDLESRRQDHFDDFDSHNQRIEYYDNFHGLEATIISEIKNKSGPSEIRVFYENGEEKEIEIRNRNSVIRDVERLLV